MKWEVRELSDGRWGVFLVKKYCKTDEPVCYGASRTEASAKSIVNRMNKKEKDNVDAVS
jgi:hypothetical protein